jgi:hypothetical protein
LVFLGFHFSRDAVTRNEVDFSKWAPNGLFENLHLLSGCVSTSGGGVSVAWAPRRLEEMLTASPVSSLNTSMRLALIDPDRLNSQS